MTDRRWNDATFQGEDVDGTLFVRVFNADGTQELVEADEFAERIVPLLCERTARKKWDRRRAARHDRR